MAFATKTFEQHLTETATGLTAGIGGADAALAANNLAPVSRIIAGHRHDLDLALAYASDQKFVAFCADDLLDRHGAEMKPPVPRKPASPARGFATVTSGAAASVSTGAVFTRSDGARFVALAGIVMPGAGSATVDLIAETAGASGATAAGATLAATSGVTGTVSAVVAAGGLGGAADIEGAEAYRARLLFAKAFPEHAGAPADWLRYTLAVPGVTRAYIDPLAAGRGTVVVYPFFDLTRANGIPLESDRLQVANALFIARPGAGLPVVRAAAPVVIDSTIAGLTPATPESQAAVVAEIAATIARNGRPAGLSTPHPDMPFLATAQVFSRSWIWQAAANAAGEERHSVTLPASDVTLTEGQIAVPGAVTFV
jgi:uncharacterized phage protein gp47/JayE